MPASDWTMSETLQVVGTPHGRRVAVFEALEDRVMLGIRGQQRCAVPRDCIHQHLARRD